MRYDEFLAKIRERGEYTDRVEAEKITSAVLDLLACRLTADEVEQLCAQLPVGPATAMTPSPPEKFDLGEFLRRLAATTGGTEKTVQWDASAVLSTVAEAITRGELDNVLAQLPGDYALLFGTTALTR